MITYVMGHICPSQTMTSYQLQFYLQINGSTFSVRNQNNIFTRNVKIPPSGAGCTRHTDHRTFALANHVTVKSVILKKQKF